MRARAAWKPALLTFACLVPTLASAEPPRAPLLLAQFPLDAPVAAASEGTLPSGFGEGGRIVVVPPKGRPRLLSTGFASAADPEVSFDGMRILFAGKQKAGDPWCIWEMQRDGSGVHQITCGPGGARHPLYLPTMYTINPKNTDAWDRIAFVGTLPGETNEAGVGPHTAIFTCTRDGQRLRRISFNLSSDLDPMLLPDGRLVFASWQRRSPSHGPQGRVALFAMQTDGVDLMIFSGDEGRRVKRMPAYAGNRLVVFVEGDAAAADGGGTLADVSLRRNLHSYRSLSQPGDGLYHSPSTDVAGGVLVSWRAEGGQYGVYHFDPASGERTPVFDDPQHHDVEAKWLAVRPLPDRRSSSVQDADPEGGLYGLDVGISDLGPDVFPRGIARRLRVLEGIPMAAGTARGAVPSRRVLGEVPLAGDGSYHVQVPADVPLEVQLVDENGLALRSCGWIWVRNHEQRGCIGCHEDPERTPPNRFVEALDAPPPTLDPAPDARRTLSYERDVAPIVARRCLGCHGPDGTPPNLAGDARAALEGEVRPGRARTSPLSWHLFGRVTRRPWDADAAGAAAVAPGGIPLTPEELRTVIEWIDLGAAWSGGAR